MNRRKSCEGDLFLRDKRNLIHPETIFVPRTPIGTAEDYLYQVAAVMGYYGAGRVRRASEVRQLIRVAMRYLDMGRCLAFVKEGNHE